MKGTMTSITSPSFASTNDIVSSSTVSKGRPSSVTK